jgi:hypothetical protein
LSTPEELRRSQSASKQARAQPDSASPLQPLERPRLAEAIHWPVRGLERPFLPFGDGGSPAHDATAAFAYYIEHYNHGRPFILAGHSQGSNVLLFLLSGYLRHHPAVYRRMVVAYVIGYGVTRSYLAKNPELKFATGANDTGVIVSWNTEAPGLTIKNPVVNPGSIAINPITWTRSQRPASASESLGSLLPNAAGKLVKVKHYADARVDKRRGTIVCSTCSVSLYAPGKPGGFPKGIFHIHDYPFYYFDLRHNATVRIRRFSCSGCGRG